VWRLLSGWVLLYLFDLSLSDEQGFARAGELLGSTPAKLVIWAVLAALIYHCVAGVKHLLMDLGYRRIARRGASRRRASRLVVAGGSHRSRGGVGMVTAVTSFGRSGLSRLAAAAFHGGDPACLRAVRGRYPAFTPGLDYATWRAHFRRHAR
jgi:hypothetical protein